MLIGITGQTGAGKTTFCNALRDVGINVIDGDIIARAVTAPNTDCTKQIGETFENVILPDKSLDRRKLGDIVFKNSEKLTQLNNIIFPYVLKAVDDLLEKSTEKVNCLDAPTLFESGADKKCDLIIAVIANNKDEQINRLMKRDNITKEQVLNRIKSQKSTDFFTENADIIVNNRNMDKIIELILNIQSK
ncbi:MAG: dephospho-CoA kinase [Oscillospiraceae bacterium]|jgi:dephospho-CoA kinase|nr:dephospho-CoA kinase [Oscillospiraceae bacterium]